MAAHTSKHEGWPTNADERPEDRQARSTLQRLAAQVMVVSARAKPKTANGENGIVHL
jgi:hypothetical protein